MQRRLYVYSDLMSRYNTIVIHIQCIIDAIRCYTFTDRSSNGSIDLGKDLIPKGDSLMFIQV